MEYYVYILRSKKDSKRYIGSTSNVLLRLEKHNRGLVISTRNRCPMKLIHTELFHSKSEAQVREKFFKTGKGRECLKSQDL